MEKDNLDSLLKLLTPNIRLSIRIEFGPDDCFTFSTDYIGSKGHKFLVVDYPKKVQSNLIMRQLKNGQVVIRAITQSKLGHIVAFKSTIIDSTTSPTGLIFIRMPSHFATKPIREHERYPIDIPVTVTANTVSYQGILSDISLNGCAIFIKGEDKLGKQTAVQLESELSPLLPDNLTSTIVSVEKRRFGHLFGVKFDQTLEFNEQIQRVLLEKSFNATLV
ncbi:PilZ domain-containing protein [Vibrio fluminensis]|uniref:PilZ domain-containing protein n=1 Tax=Vibrio fluminensis TaxID=2783614 RepID=UPI001887EBA9|nr:PilZ domain-containing protein [Vibrio fluminensis]